MIEMEKPEYMVTYTTNKFPTGLKTAEEVEELTGIKAERISELAQSGFMPHYRIDGGTYRYKPAEVKQWAAENLVYRHKGSQFLEAIRVVIPAPPATDRPPSSIEHIQQLQQLPVNGYQPGVYFLCNQDEVVYVGQSITPHSRVSFHTTDRTKTFDRVYLIPVPSSELNDVESAFIQHLAPKCNGRGSTGKLMKPRTSRPVQDIIRDVLGAEVV